MQSQLEAALLGHSSNVNTSTTVDDDENNFHDDDGDEVEDYVDEDLEGENVSRGGKLSTGPSATSRTVTLQMLLAADILQPGNGTMTIEYLGQRFVGDLLEDGKIRSQETDIVFASPSAWAIACKRFINPEKKSGCGWASVKYRGKKLDAYKNIWYRKKKEERNQEFDGTSELEIFMQKALKNTMQYHRMIVKHNTIANRTLTHDANTLIECVPFSNIGKIQPFLVSLSTNAALLMDFHCHLMKSEVCGYLAGHWDVNNHNLQITSAFPCRNTKSDRENAQNVETEISRAIDKENLTLVGWYHSHPFAAAAPTLRDVDAQLDYQIRMKGTSDNNYTPCIGIIISPYNYDNSSLESSIVAYWVVPPPETKPNEYGRPMLMSYSVIQDSLITQNIKDEMKKCVDYYKKESDFVNFSDRYLNTNLYIDKLKSTLISKFPRDESETTLWRFIREILGFQTEENDCLLSIPSISKSQMLPSLSSNVMLSTDISNILFNSGKFPTASSLLGLPDPMAQSTLAANNMFLSTNLFKMQELLKPLSTSSPILGKTKEQKHALKIPSDIKGKSDFAADLLNLKNKLDFIAPELNLPKSDMDYSLNLSKSAEVGERPQKVPKNDFNVFDLSSGKNSEAEATDLSISNEQKTSEEKPLNLVVD
ncbi:MPN domain-containing protein CG4751 isoform X1 [Tribolium castaneum]|uniref:MPN domain-containing protein CG4751-like Protein n=2 Tax=Tribolium castaneum TaxID=7070 RepID=D6WN26_TRICA|nr:PREDICTED: MPN domain-containing protein CG4751 isoform X1 [Tribolium castaneum]EFA03246.1 MPN domain-containing protein CG4751-like Protein [Tribolium castaneum]|eukprot:XP_971342.1 PREDICTED: MPN domain-containing protein CG4751 isoform X1 [Tribolium castaneum]